MLALLYKYFTEFHIRTIYSSPLRNLTSVNSWQQWSRSTPATCRQVSCQPQSSEGHSLGTSANLPGRSQRRFLFMNTHFPCIYFVCFVLEISCELVVGTFNFVDFVHFVPRKQKGSIKQDKGKPCMMLSVRLNRSSPRICSSGLRRRGVPCGYIVARSLWNCPRRNHHGNLKFFLSPPPRFPS